ncbi:ankyrin repeat domain-containing protein [Arthrobacter sp. BE255]|uniref:ankyrin repeat domain-containing protein n=1 Tax=Arthrobacter sp. BE255 TaxID=2817721 RepID=UPI002858AE76|nr:ankyrin repeat domain-containing protein [Arthrobacter sp. BE255]MDR7158454.1 ankyrin repeat protein [Arthrobacter sp. BE255]
MPSNPSTPRTLGFAVWSDNLALVRELLNAGATVDNYGSEAAADVTPLMESVDELEPFYDASRLVLTQLLLSAGADVARRDNAGRTALHYAVGAGAMAVEVLLAAGSDVNAAGDGGATPLHEAIVRGNVSAIKALCQGGANCNARDQTGRTPADLLSENKDAFTSEELAAAKLLLGSS